jgi:hypothetical protein
MKAALDELPGWLRRLDDGALGEPLIEIRELINRSEAAFADWSGGRKAARRR